MRLQWLRAAFGILVFSNAYAQDEAEIEKLMRKRLLSCTDITLNSSILIPQYLNDGKLDSAKIILKYWEDKCGALEPIVRTKILLAVRESRFKEDIYDRSIIDYLLYYKNRVTALREVDAIHWRNVNLWYGYPLDDAFDAFTTYAATELLDEKERRLFAHRFL
ncbi:hypothetical protein L0337_39355 [candidate division KSB1 bacterium]|nr:hypothetical protein [candidate division KSB1 bacterium]